MNKVLMVAVVLSTMMFSTVTQAKMYKFAGCWYSESPNQNDGKPLLLYCEKNTASQARFDIKKVPLKLRSQIVDQSVSQ